MSTKTTVAAPLFRISVTQREIDTAVQANSGHCMFADATKRSFGERYKRKAGRVSVDLQTVRFTDPEKGLRYVYLTPAVAQKALVQFDQGIKPTEFKCTLRNGQAVRSTAKPRPTGKRKSSAKQKQAARANIRKALKKRAELKVTVHGQKSMATDVKIIGGKVPPKAALSGNRRQFGMRRLGELNGPTQ